MSTQKSKNAPTDAPFIRLQAEAAALVEPADLSRFEGEGGPEAPDPATAHPKQQGLFPGADETG